MKSGYLKNNRIMMGISILALSGSLLAGCGKSDPLADMFNSGEPVEIIAVSPDFVKDEQGEQDELIWEQLALLSTNPTLRKSWNNTLGIIGSQESTNGILYVNELGDQDINNTLRVALHNTEFQKILSASVNDSILSALANAALSNYADIEINDANNRNEVMKAIYMAINGYFNLLPDNIPNYCNADSTITRAQFMAMVFRADTPVQDIESDGIFTNIVGPSEYNIYAQGVANNSYLDLEYKGLNPQTYNSNITRGEVIYLLVNRYYSNELKLVNIKESGVSFSDCKNAGNIAANQKIIKDATTKDYWKSYELAYALQNADDGMPEEMYKAMIVAQQNGLIGTETRWDEACTLSEAIELLVKAILNEKGFSNYTAKLGTTDTGYIADTTEIQEEPELEGNGTGYHLNESENNYLAEAKTLWSDNNLSEELECNEETFNETYMGLRESGKTPDEAYAEATEMFKPQPKPQQTKPQQTQQPVEQKPAEQPQQPVEQPSNDGYDHAPTNQPGGMPAGSSTGRNNSLTEDGAGAAYGQVGNFE